MSGSLKWYERGNMGLLIPGILMVVVGIGCFAGAFALSTALGSLIITGITLVGTGGFMIWFGWGTNFEKQEEQQILTSGVKAHATIITATPTGIVVNKHPQYEFVVRLVIPDHPAYQTVHKQGVPPDITPESLAPGRVLTVYSQPNDPLDIVIDFAESGPAPHPTGQL